MAAMRARLTPGRPWLAEGSGRAKVGPRRAARSSGGRLLAAALAGSALQTARGVASLEGSCLIRSRPWGRHRGARHAARGQPPRAGDRLRLPVRRGAERGGPRAARALVQLAAQALARARRPAARQARRRRARALPGARGVTPEVHAWLSDSDRWRALVSVGAHDGAGAFVLRTISGEPPESLLRASVGDRPGRIVDPVQRRPRAPGGRHRRRAPGRPRPRERARARAGADAAGRRAHGRDRRRRRAGADRLSRLGRRARRPTSAPLPEARARPALRPFLRPRCALGGRRARRPGARSGDRRVRGEPPAGARGGAGRGADRRADGASTTARARRSSSHMPRTPS